MKRLKTTIPNGGAPLGQFPVLKELFDDATKDAIEALLAKLLDGRTQGAVLSGCEITGTASNWDIAEGYVYLDGKVLRSLESTGNGTGDTVYLRAFSAAETGGVFADGLSKNYITEVFAAPSAGTGSGVQYVTFNFGVEPVTLRQAIINTDSVNTAAIQDDAITNDKMALLSVGTAELINGSVTDDKAANTMPTSDPTIFTGDVDTLVRPQIRPIDGGATNLPAGYSGVGIMTVAGLSGGTLVQQLMSSTTGVIYCRNKIGAGAFTAWVTNTA